MSEQTYSVMRAAGAAFVLDHAGTRAPRILHWGRDLGPLTAPDIAALRVAHDIGQGHSSFDTPLAPSIAYDAGEGFAGVPTVSGHRNGTAFSTVFVLEQVDASENTVTVRMIDAQSQLRLTSRFSMSDQGALKVRHSLTNLGGPGYVVDALTAALPVPAQASEVMDFMGNWSREFHPQVKPIEFGSYVREIREGRSGHDNTMLFMARTANTTFQSGDVWALSLAWSGNSRYFVERLADGTTRLGASELLLPGEVILDEGVTYDMPEVYAVFSSNGLDGVAAIFHDHLRARPQHPSTPRPLTINVWEAVYMDHRFEKLEALADVAAEIGVERFVLDDGWFGARRDDRAGLGDWVVSSDAWPEGLGTLARCLEQRGLEFGLWFEPEMVNVDSDLFRAHPDWILHVEGRTPPEWRYQQVLDLAHEGAYTHVLGQMGAILTEYPSIRFLKWDHNRVLTDAGHLGHAGVRTQTLAVYRLIDELKRRHAGLEIESCASGGGRIDLGIIERTDRVHASDNNEALERQRIQRWTTQVLPPELVDSHICPERSHTTGRTIDLGFRAITGLFGHAGIEWDITETTSEERALLASWVRYYKANRELLHGGRMLRIDHPSSDASAHGVIAHDRSRAIVAYVQEGVSKASRPALLRIPGLDPERRYRVIEVRPAGAPRLWQIRPPAWMSDGVEATGRVLGEVGLIPPILTVEQAILIEITSV